MRKSTQFVISAALSLLIFNLTSCGGGGDEPGNNGGGSTINLPENIYLYYLTGWTVGSELVAVDPTNPPMPTDPKDTLLSEVNYLSSFNDITPDFNDFNVNDRATLDLTGYTFEPYVIALNSTGFSKFSADLLKPNTISKVSTATGGILCDIDRFTDINKEYYIYETSDDGCATIARRQMINSEMDSATTPVDVPIMPMTELFNTQLQLTGWLANNNGELTRYDADFSSPIDIDTLPEGISYLYPLPTPLGTYLLISFSDLFIYDPTANSLTNVYSASSGAVGIYDYNLDGIVFVDGNTIYRANWAFSSPPEIIATESNAASIDPYWTFSKELLVYSYSQASGEIILVALDLVTGDKTILDTLPSGDTVQLADGTPGRLFYNVSGPSTRRAESVLFDNTGRQSFDNARWVGSAYGNQLDDQGYYTDITMILLNNTLPGQTDLNDTVLESYDANSMGKISDLGALPDGFEDDFIFGIHGSNKALLFNLSLTSNRSDEVFFMSPLVDGSLQRLTDNDTNDIALSGSIARLGSGPTGAPFSGSDMRGDQEVSGFLKSSNKNMLFRKIRAVQQKAPR